jgi:hypothetical protein
MKSITVHTALNAPAAAVWATVQRPETFVHVAGAMLRYPVAEQHPGPWRVGDRTDGWVFLFRLIPFSRHTIEVASIDDTDMTLLTEEGGGLVRTWRHYVKVDPLTDDTCRYEDRIDIDAGILTPVVAAFAEVFYRYRQRRWRRLAPLLAASASHVPA